MSTAGTTGAIAAAAAAAKRKRMQEEEEDMTGYNKDELDGWEFKIVRANTRKFKTREAVEALCKEEAKAGWEMVEKFDDSRIRFKRRIDRRSMDKHLDIDPYRSQVGLSEGKIAGIVIGILALVGGLVFLAVMLAQR